MDLDASGFEDDIARHRKRWHWFTQPWSGRHQALTIIGSRRSGDLPRRSSLDDFAILQQQQPVGVMFDPRQIVTDEQHRHIAVTAQADE